MATAVMEVTEVMEAGATHTAAGATPGAADMAVRVPRLQTSTSRNMHCSTCWPVLAYAPNLDIASLTIQ
jgi:hypothetical protein